MKIEVNITKSRFYALVASISLFILTVAVVAFNSNPANPSVFGHSAAEIEGVCYFDGTEWVNCPPAASTGSTFGGGSCEWVDVSSPITNIEYTDSNPIGTCRINIDIPSWSSSRYMYGVMEYLPDDPSQTWTMGCRGTVPIFWGITTLYDLDEHAYDQDYEYLSCSGSDSTNSFTWLDDPIVINDNWVAPSGGGFGFRESGWRLIDNTETLPYANSLAIIHIQGTVLDPLNTDVGIRRTGASYAMTLTRSESEHSTMLLDENGQFEYQLYAPPNTPAAVQFMIVGFIHQGGSGSEAGCDIRSGKVTGLVRDTDRQVTFDTPFSNGVSPVVIITPDTTSSGTTTPQSRVKSVTNTGFIATAQDHADLHYAAFNPETCNGNVGLGVGGGSSGSVETAIAFKPQGENRIQTVRGPSEAFILLNGESTHPDTGFGGGNGVACADGWQIAGCWAARASGTEIDLLPHNNGCLLDSHDAGSITVTCMRGGSSGSGSAPQIITCTDTEIGNNPRPVTCTAQCPTGTFVTGGGCETTNAPQNYQSKPTTDGSGWECSTPYNPSVQINARLEGYAVCS